MATAQTSERLFLTISLPVLELVNKVITPAGFFKPPKGSHSQLVEVLFQEYLEKQFGADILDILDFFKENEEADLNAAREYFRLQRDRAAANDREIEAAIQATA